MSRDEMGLIKSLREMSKAGIGECKKALVECDWDLEKAYEHLRVSGMAKAAKMSDRETKEGVVTCFYDSQNALLLEVLCQTDFVAMNDMTKSLVHELRDMFLKAGSWSEALKEEMMPIVQQSASVTGENMRIGASEYYDLRDKSLVFGHYIHREYSKDIGKVGAAIVLRAASQPQNRAAVEAAASEIAMHAVAMRPLAVSKEALSAEVVDQERRVVEGRFANADKPKEIVDKMIAGAMDKFYKESVLTEQQLVTNDKLTVAEYLRAVAKEAGVESLEIERYSMLVIEGNKS